MQLAKKIDSVRFGPPRSSTVGEKIQGLEGRILDNTDDEREIVCQALDKRGLWSTDLPEILGLVDR